MVELIILIPAGIFFLLCAYAKYDETLMEQFFGFEHYWRTIGWIGAPTSGILYIVLSRLTLYGAGTVKIGTDKIEISSKSNFESYDVSRITDLTFKKDIPHQTDERTDSQKASRLTFNYQGRTVDLELRTFKKADFEQLIPITKHWRDNIKGYRETYN